MSTTVTRGRVGQFESLVLENPFLRAVTIPQLGGRVWELEDRVRGKQWIWHRSDVPLGPSRPGTPYDDVWAGGWEELFPNDEPGFFEGRDLPDHGEWWTTAWSVADVAEGAIGRVNLAARLLVIRASCTKELSLPADRAALEVHYRIRSEERAPFHFLFKQHLAVQVAADCRLALPGGTASVVDPSFGTLVTTSDPFAWPSAPGRDGPVDLRLVPAATAAAREFLYVRDLPDAWCGIDDLRRGASLRMRFDSRQLPFVWLFLTYGGWRGLYTAVLEPCSNMPKNLHEAVERRQAARLEPGRTFETRVTVTLAGCEGSGP